MRNFIVAFVASMIGSHDGKDHINTVAVSHESMPSMTFLQEQISEALKKSNIHPGYMVVKVTILAISELSSDDISAYIKGSDEIVFVEM